MVAQSTTRLVMEAEEVSTEVIFVCCCDSVVFPVHYLGVHRTSSSSSDTNVKAESPEEALLIEYFRSLSKFNFEQCREGCVSGLSGVIWVH